jgi:tetratricopeptide (TPR) repeat protein
MTESRRICAWLLANAVALAPFPLPAEPTAADNHIGYYQRILQRNPRDARTYHRLGDALIRKARESGDVSYFERAEEALRRSLELAPANAGAWRHLAYAAYSRHEFDPATVHARKALELDPRDGHAWGVLGDALLETGRYVEAENAYRRMMEIEVDLHALSRRAGLRSMRGDTAGAVADLERAVAEGRAAGRPAESVAWALAQLAAEHFAVGQLDRAGARYLEALQAYPGYHRGLAGLAQVRAAQNRDEEAIRLYTRSIAVVPLPEYAAALGDVLARRGRGEEARRQYDLVEYIGHLSAVNKTLYNRELAYFYADHDRKLETALDLARGELGVRRDVYAYDVLAWALLKNGRAGEARTAITEALKLGTRDAKLFFHAGLIHAALGEDEQAREYLTRALATNPRFHVLHAQLAARTLASLERPALGEAGVSRGPK